MSFDAGKENNMIISTVDPLGGPIKALDINFDNKLFITNAVHKCATTTARNTRYPFNTRSFYFTVELMMIYKSHVMSYI